MLATDMAKILFITTATLPTSICPTVLQSTYVCANNRSQKNHLVVAITTYHLKNAMMLLDISTQKGSLW
jgi:hypothetical protein